MNMKKRLNNLNLVLLLLLVIFVIISFSGIYILRSSGVDVRLIPISELKRSHYYAYDTNLVNSELYGMLEENGFSNKDKTIEQVFMLMTFIGNSVKNVGVYWGEESSFELYKMALSGTPLACGSMSRMMNDALLELGYESRIIQLYRTEFSSTDTHVLVEVFLDGEWRLLDPTFNITYHKNGMLLGVSKVQELLRKEGPLAVSIKYHGDRNYPARIKDYYMDWRPLFGNAYVVEYGNSKIGKLPPLRWWYGPKLYYFGDQAILWVKSANKIYFLFVVVFPIISALTAALIVFLRIKKFRMYPRLIV